MLDLACGAGVVGAVYKKISPETIVDFSDSSLLAREATRKTLELNKLDGNVIQSDVFSDITSEYDLIAVNPPFHKGIGTDYSFIDTLIMTARDHLTKNGKLLVIANSFLAYREKLETIGQTTEIYRDKKFALYSTEKGRLIQTGPRQHRQ
jgi:16S rRNA (guanine1207-N2)-methyltransferase